MVEYLKKQWKRLINKNKMEERNIKISLEKAKEWYKQGGDLKQVALQAFDEDELKGEFPTSWSEYDERANWEVDRINAGSLPGSADYCHFATREEADAFVALGKLIQLRDEYWKLDNNWKPVGIELKYGLFVENIGSTFGDVIKSCTSSVTNHVLTFRTPELRDKFYGNFKDLIEEAKMFL